MEDPPKNKKGETMDKQEKKLDVKTLAKHFKEELEVPYANILAKRLAAETTEDSILSEEELKTERQYLALLDQLESDPARRTSGREEDYLKLLIRIARKPDISKNLFRGLLESGQISVYHEIIKNPNTPSDILEKFSEGNYDTSIKASAIERLNKQKSTKEESGSQTDPNVSETPESQEQKPQTKISFEDSISYFVESVRNIDLLDKKEIDTVRDITVDENDTITIDGLYSAKDQEGHLIPTGKEASEEDKKILEKLNSSKNKEMFVKYVQAKEYITSEHKKRLETLHTILEDEKVSKEDRERAVQAVESFDKDIALAYIDIKENHSKWYDRAIKGYRWLGDQNLSKVWKVENKWGQAVLRIASLRTVVSAGLITSGALLSGGGAFAALAGAAALRGTGAGVGTYDLLNIFGTERGLRKKVGKVSNTNEVLYLKSKFESFAKQTGRKDLLESNEYRELTGKYAEIVQQEFSKQLEKTQKETGQNKKDARIVEILRKHNRQQKGAEEDVRKGQATKRGIAVVVGLLAAFLPASGQKLLSETLNVITPPELSVDDLPGQLPENGGSSSSTAVVGSATEGGGSSSPTTVVGVPGSEGAPDGAGSSVPTVAVGALGSVESDGTTMGILLNDPEYTDTSKVLSTPTIPDYEVQHGDTVWRILGNENIMGEGNTLTSAERAKFLQKLALLDEGQRKDLIKSFGIPSSKIDLIRPGENINLNKIKEFIGGGQSGDTSAAIDTKSMQSLSGRLKETWESVASEATQNKDMRGFFETIQSHPNQNELLERLGLGSLRDAAGNIDVDSVTVSELQKLNVEEWKELMKVYIEQGNIDTEAIHTSESSVPGPESQPLYMGGSTEPSVPDSESQSLPKLSVVVTQDVSIRDVSLEVGENGTLIVKIPEMDVEQTVKINNNNVNIAGLTHEKLKEILSGLFEKGVISIENGTLVDADNHIFQAIEAEKINITTDFSETYHNVSYKGSVVGGNMVQGVMRVEDWPGSRGSPGNNAGDIRRTLDNLLAASRELFGSSISEEYNNMNIVVGNTHTYMTYGELHTFRPDFFTDQLPNNTEFVIRKEGGNLKALALESPVSAKNNFNISIKELDMDYVRGYTDGTSYSEGVSV